ncbi:MAG: S8 family serine peptidase [Bdellovibrionales bacterium]|nr:S8 family serine peptidase [Bdellovibrionales bacterium]
MSRILAVLAVLGILSSCKEKDPPPPPPRVKKVVRVSHVDTRWIELDDGSRYGMGENLYNRLVSRLKANDHFVVVVDEPWNKEGVASATARQTLELQSSDRLKFDFAPFVVADFRASVEELTFTHGSRGAKRFAGFRRDYRTPWNDGTFDGSNNEYPSRSTDLSRSWFGGAFEPLPQDGFDTISGVDAGEGGEFNLIIANIHYRRDRFVATGSLDTELRFLVDEEVRRNAIDVGGTGFLFALGVGYKALSVEFGIARRTALSKVFDKSADRLVDEIQEQMKAAKFRTRVERNGEHGIVLNAGRREGIQVGDQFEVRSGGGATKLRVTEAFQIGALAEVVEGPSAVREGDIVTIVDEPVEKTIASVQRRSISVDLPEFSDPDGGALVGSKDSVVLPYLLWRWSQYDQDIDPDFVPAPPENDFAKAQSQWNLRLVDLAEAWRLAPGRGSGVKVALIDSGVDYNHVNLGAAFSRSYAGVDFISMDRRPFDDNSHGTALAGLVAARGVGKDPVGIAPGTTLLSYRAFNPWGETTSAALHASAERAIRDGARILLLGWDTRSPSKALSSLVDLAARENVLLVTAAGDQGQDIDQGARFPANFSQQPHVITVPSVDESGNLSRASGRQANYGERTVDIAAPGDRLPVLAPRSTYLTRNGSDLAAAHVAGVAALLLGQNPALPAAELKSRILQGAANSANLEGKVAGARLLSASGALR